MTKPPALVLSFVCLAACRAQAPEQAQPAPASSEPPVASAPVQAPAQPSADGEHPAAASLPPAEPVADPVEPAQPAVITATGPEPAVTPSDHVADPVLVALGRGDPQGIEILASHEHGRTRIVLFHVDVGSRFRASQGEGSELLDRLDERADTCDSEEYDTYMIHPCTVAAAIELGIAADVAPHLVWSDSYAWELAQVERDRQGQVRVVARKRLLDFSLAGDSEDYGIETKLKVYDIDADKRSEILVVFPYLPPSESMHDAEFVALGYILDKVDFHVQYATTRKYYSEHSHVSFDSTNIDTTWLAKDTNGDGHPDLSVRELRVDFRGGDEDSPGDSTERKSRSTVCLYELVGDRWICPDALGTEVIDGSKLVEVTRVPVVLEPAADANAPAGR